MEHYFRTALWIFVLIGCLQAVPVLKQDFHFNDLQDATCNGNVTFKSPKSVPESCLAAVVKTIEEGLLHAEKSCQCSYCGYALENLEKLRVPSPASNSSECTTGKEGSLPFKTFLEEFQHVIERNNFSFMQ